MNILHIFHGSNLNNGVDRTSYTLIKNLLRLGVHPSAVVPIEGRVSQLVRELGIPCHIIPFHCCESTVWRAQLKFLSDITKGYSQLQELIAIGRYDLIHINTGHLMQAGIAAAKSSIPSVWHIHSPFLVDYARYESLMAPEGYAWLLEQLASMIITVSDDVRDSLLGYVREERLQTVFNGIDIEDLDASANSPGRDIRKDLGFTSATQIVISVGRVSRQKDFAAFARVADLVLRSNPDVRFLIVGPNEEQDAVIELTSAIENSALHGKVIMLGARDDVPRLLLQSDLFLSTAIYEGQGLAALEAMVLGKPVVAMSCVGLRECLRDGIDSLLVSLGDETRAAEAVVELLGNRAKSEVMGAAGRQSVMERFSSQKYAQEFMSVADKAIRFGAPPISSGALAALTGLLRDYPRAEEQIMKLDTIPSVSQKIRRLFANAFPGR